MIISPYYQHLSIQVSSLIITLNFKFNYDIINAFVEFFSKFLGILCLIFKKYLISERNDMNEYMMNIQILFYSVNSGLCSVYSVIRMQH